MVSMSTRIKEAMALRGYKQIDLVEKTGINKGALSCYISGKYKPKQNNIFLLANALDVNEAWLMGADVPMERSDQMPPSQWQDHDEFVEEQKCEEQWRYEDFISTMGRIYKQLNFTGQENLLQAATDMLDIKRFHKDTSQED